MLAEYLEHAPVMYAEWTGVAPGTNVCRFALPDGKYPVAIPAALRPMHFEALFCTGGTLAITRRNEPESRGQAVLGRQSPRATPWVT